jgi:hypothetical protein
MPMNSILKRGVRIVAEIHHSHGVKAAVSVADLRLRFPEWSDDFWHAALQRAKWFDEPTVEHAVIVPAAVAPPRRAQVLLARAVIPASYGAVRAWAASAGTEAVIAHYLTAACADPEYLGHRLSVLLAFQEAWPLYRDGPDAVLFLDRLTEFLIACRFSPSADEGPTSSTTWDDALAAALQRPGFFGHHLICLSWVARSRDLLGPQRVANALAWVVEASRATHADAEDNLVIAPPESAPVTPAALELALGALLTRGVRNVHLLTLADAIACLWTDASSAQRAFLLALAERFTEAEPTGAASG